MPFSSIGRTGEAHAGSPLTSAPRRESDMHKTNEAEVLAKAASDACRSFRYRHCTPADCNGRGKDQLVICVFCTPLEAESGELDGL
jgi:hypothetical protein